MIINQPTILTDKSRLQEIYDLRVEAYEHSEKSIYVNKQTYPNGWFDEIDEKEETIHWIIEDKSKIVASARLAILNDIKETGDELNQFEFPLERPFAYWSRLVVHPDYRMTNAMMMLDNVRKTFLINHSEIKFALCWATRERHNTILHLGFKYLGDIIIKWKGDKEQCISIYIYLN